LALLLLLIDCFWTSLAGTAGSPGLFGIRTIKPVRFKVFVYSD